MTITKKQVQDLENKYLLQEIAKTDQVVLKFLDDSKVLLNHIDKSNDSKFSMIKTNLREFLEEANLMEPEE